LQSAPAAAARSNERRPRGGERFAFSASPLLVVKLPAWRSKLLLFALFCGFVALMLRAVYLQAGGGKTEYLQRIGQAAYERTLDVPATRGKVTDRNGIVLAASVPARAVWAIPEDVEATPQQLAQLAQLLEMPLAEVKRLLARENQSFVFLRRPVDADVAEKIAALKIPGVHTSRAFKRHYPEGTTAAHLVGFTDVEDRGQDGIEAAFDSTLAGRNGSRRVVRDEPGRVVEDDWLREPVDGSDLSLSIDNRIQYIAFSALRQAIDRNDARAGAVVVLDVRSGEVLALANWPTFDPNRRDKLHGERLRSHALSYTFEPGSTLKPFSIAAALEARKITPLTRIQTAPGHLTIGNRTIRDTHPHGVLTVEEIVAKSSNVGTAKIALELPAQNLWDLYTGVGFGQPPRVGLAGAAPGRLRPYKTWRPIEQATISYGYGVSVSLLQLARAYTVFARDGDLVPLTFTRNDYPATGVQVMRPETARAVRRMLELAVTDEGTAPAARVAGYRVAGKTGTARKIEDRRYVNKYVGSFAGFAPVSDPRIVVAVMIDEPNASRGRYYGGDVAAPVFSQITAAALRTLQVAPDAAPADNNALVLLSQKSPSTQTP
jgi:cell division protein FtsI (penicillin-binding protein 3)